jgi:hypothetical protein
MAREGSLDKKQRGKDISLPVLGLMIEQWFFFVKREIRSNILFNCQEVPPNCLTLLRLLAILINSEL